MELKNQSDQDSSWIKGKTRFKHVEKEAVELINLITGSQIAGEEKNFRFQNDQHGKKRKEGNDHAQQKRGKYLGTEDLL